MALPAASLSFTDAVKLYFTSLVEPLTELWESGSIKRKVVDLCSVQGMKTVAQGMKDHPLETLSLAQPLFPYVLSPEMTSMMQTAVQAAKCYEIVHITPKHIKKLFDSGLAGKIVVILGISSIPAAYAYTCSYPNLVEAVSDPSLNAQCPYDAPIEELYAVAQRALNEPVREEIITHSFTRHPFSDGFRPVSVTGSCPPDTMCYLAAPHAKLPHIEICFDLKENKIDPLSVRYGFFPTKTSTFKEIDTLTAGETAYIVNIEGCSFPLPPRKTSRELLDMLTLIDYDKKPPGLLFFSASTTKPRIHEIVFIPQNPQAGEECVLENGHYSSKCAKKM